MNWKTAWKYQTIEFNSSLGSLSGVTQKFQVKMPVRAGKLRLLLDNRLQKYDMALKDISVAVNAQSHAVQVNGQTEITIPAGSSIYSDTVELPIKAGEILQVQMHFQQMPEVNGLYQTWSTEFWKTEFFNSEGLPIASNELFPIFRSDAIPSTVAAGIGQIDVWTEDSVRTIALFGDSITQMSYYSDALLERLATEFPGKAVVINAGISGNRLCYDAPSKFPALSFFGTSGVSRFTGDVLAHKPDIILMLYGINDVTQGFLFQAKHEIPAIDSFCREYADIIHHAHQNGAKIYVGTILPENTFATEKWYAHSETLRHGINAWIESQSPADGVIDFAEATCNYDGSLKDGFHLDGLHPNAMGGKAMAAIIPLKELLN